MWVCGLYVVMGLYEFVSSNRAFDLERAACAIFGMATFGVHMTGTSAIQLIHNITFPSIRPICPRTYLPSPTMS